ncbi:MAG TPA: 50S ribosomal protein L22 [Bacteroidales bacterium]|nr:50S ribosomal protein L22 [Lentimicrobiaceae bacterium]HOH99923.1 50S ribosomal protein L22 [Bacteroidales bacterium]
MGARKRLRAEQIKEAKKTQYGARLNNCPTSPRKMRLVAGLIRGKELEDAMGILKFTNKEAAGRMYKLLLSAVANWQAKNEGVRIEDSGLFVKEVMVDGGRTLKRIQPAPQGRAHRIRKRSNHVTLVLGDRRGVELAQVEEADSAEA